MKKNSLNIKNKNLLLKYLSIFIMNIVLVIFVNFYLNKFEYSILILLFLVVIMDSIIYYYNDECRFNPILDILLNFIVGFILMWFIKNINIYSNTLFSIFFANNIVFMRSRYSDKFYKRFFQYIMIFVYTILCLLVNNVLFLVII